LKLCSPCFKALQQMRDAPSLNKETVLKSNELDQSATESQIETTND